MLTTNSTSVSLNFKPRSRQETIGLSVSLAFIIALSVLGNSLLIFVFWKHARLRASFANKLILSLAVADFMTASFPMSYQLATILDVNLISNSGLLCTIGGLFSYSTFTVSVLSMVMLSVDRFVALGYPLQYNVRMNSRVKIFMIAYPWVHGALFTIFFGSFLEIKFDPEGLDCGFGWSKRPMALTLFVLLIHVGIPFVLLLVLNSRILCLVRTQNRQIQDNINSTSARHENNQQDRAKNRRAKTESKLAKVSVTIVFVFLFCWTPYVVTRTLAFMGLRLSSVVMSSAVWVLHASSFVNPIIYSSLRSDFQNALWSTLKKTRVQRAPAAVLSQNRVASSERQKTVPTYIECCTSQCTARQ